MNTPLNESFVLELDEFCAACGLSTMQLREVLEYGVLLQSAPQDVTPRYSVHDVLPLREASRMKEIFDLDTFTVSLIVGYLQRIHALERELDSVQARNPRYASPSA